MYTLLSVLTCLSLFAVSLFLFSKSAETRARSRSELYYAEKIREEAVRIRISNEAEHLISDKNFKQITVEATNASVDSMDEAKEDIESKNHPVVELPMREVSLQELELDEKALDFVNKLKTEQKQEEIEIITELEDTNAWFNFPEVSLHMKERPEQGMYYVAGKVTEVLDEMSAIVSDGTGERMVYHSKVQSFEVGDVFIAQVHIHKKVWKFINLWEINEEQLQDLEAAV